MTINVYKSSDIFNSVNKKFFPYYALYKDLLDNTDSALFYSDTIGGSPLRSSQVLQEKSSALP